MNFIYKEGIEFIDWNLLYEIYKEVGLVAGLVKKEDYEGIKKAFYASYKVITAWHENTLVGACRLISDGVCYGMVYDVGVLPK